MTEIPQEGWRQRIARRAVVAQGVRRICASCHYFECCNVREGEEAVAARGECHRFPPVLVRKVADDFDTAFSDIDPWMFPVVAGWMHCGEWVEWREQDESIESAKYGGRRQ